MSSLPLRGCFVALIGPDGSGKTTVAGLLGTIFEAFGVPVTVTKEPTTGRYGQAIRESFKLPERLPKHQEARLFILDRAQHMSETVIPALLDGKVIISDRCCYDTAVYQSDGMAEMADLIDLNELLFPIPDQTYLLETEDVECLLHRIGKRTTVENIEPKTASQVMELLCRYDDIYDLLQKRNRFVLPIECSIPATTMAVMLAKLIALHCDSVPEILPLQQIEPEDIALKIS